MDIDTLIQDKSKMCSSLTWMNPQRLYSRDSICAWEINQKEVHSITVATWVVDYGNTIVKNNCWPVNKFVYQFLLIPFQTAADKYDR